DRRSGSLCSSPAVVCGLFGKVAVKQLRPARPLRRFRRLGEGPVDRQSTAGEFVACFTGGWTSVERFRDVLQWPDLPETRKKDACAGSGAAEPAGGSQRQRAGALLGRHRNAKPHN